MGFHIRIFYSGSLLLLNYKILLNSLCNCQGLNQGCQCLAIAQRRCWFEHRVPNSSILLWGKEYHLNGCEDFIAGEFGLNKNKWKSNHRCHAFGKSSSCEEAQKVIQMIVEVAGECRLNINKGKNNVLFMARFNKGRAYY